MRPDAIPVRPVGSHVDLTPPLVATLFGTGYAMRGTERVGVVRLGREVQHITARPASEAGLFLDAVDADRVGETVGLRLQGPAGAALAPSARSVCSRLVLPAGLRRAWGVEDRATLGLGPLAIPVVVETGDSPCVEIERAVWLGAGRPAEARWLPAVTFSPQPEAEGVDDRTLVVPRRVVTETDVRQARLKRKTIRLEPGQVVTPAALSLAREWRVFADGPGQ